MESIKTWFQDWSDACEYANECTPDLSFFAPREPYSALAAIAALCVFAWWWNERQINLMLEGESRLRRLAEAASTGGLRRVLDEMKELSPDRQAA